MKKWPEAFVGKAIVEIIDFLFGECDRRIVVFDKAFFEWKPVFIFDFINANSRPANPQPSAHAHAQISCLLLILLT